MVWIWFSGSNHANKRLLRKSTIILRAHVGRKRATTFRWREESVRILPERFLL